MPKCSDRLLRCHLGRLALAAQGFGFLLHETDNVIDHFGIRDIMVGAAGDEHLAAFLAATGKAQIGQGRLARSVHDTADNRQADRLGNMRKALFEQFDGLDDVKTLPRTAGTRHSGAR